MRCLLGLLLLLGPAASAFAQPKNDVEKAGLLGRVKSVEWGRIEYPLQGGKSVEGRRRPLRITAFNEGGNTAEVTSFHEDGSVSAKITYSYDEAGRNLGSEGYSVLRSGGEDKVHKHKEVFTLDGRGNRVEEVAYQTDGTISHRRLFKYDADGNRIEELFYSWNGARGARLVNTYDGRGNQITQTSYHADDSVSFKNVTSYDARNNKTEWVQYHGDTLRYRVLYRYDDGGRLREEETFEYNAPPNFHNSHAPVPGKIVFTYDDRERTKEAATYDAEGALKGKVVTRLDDRGGEVGRVEYGGDGAPRDTELFWYEQGKLLRKLSGKLSAKFEYDAQGNWTRQTHLIRPKGSGEPEAYGAEYRVITYY